MRIEIPECARCCVCLPLRCGIIVFGYLNLAFTTLLLSFESWLIAAYDSNNTVAESLQAHSSFMYRGISMHSQTWFIFILYILEIIFNVLLLIGAHRKITRLIRAYYYYGITTCLAGFLCYVLVRNDNYYPIEHIDFYLLDICLAFCGMLIQVYLLLLIRSELKKLSKQTQVCFVNHAEEVYVNQPNNEDGRNPL